MTTLSLPCRDCRVRGWSQLIILWLLAVVLLGASGLLANGDGLLSCVYLVYLAANAGLA